MYAAACSIAGGATAWEIAIKLNLDRGNVSSDLNSLVKAGRLLKQSGRPVRFFSPDEFPTCSPSIQNNSERSLYVDGDRYDPFVRMVGYESSLQMQIKQAKAAVLYPPNGLHTMIIGRTGTGKTTFAHKMYEYSVHKNMIAPSAKFIVFNCAEYA